MSSSLFQTECEVFSTLCWKIGTPVAYRALKMLERCDWVGLVSIKVRPADYVCAKMYLLDAQVSAFFKKFPGFDLGMDLEEKARKAFFDNEAMCYQTNERLSPLLFDLGHYGEVHKRLILLWRKKIREVLGRAPNVLSLDGKFGPGSTFLNLGDLITLPDKLSDNYTTTRHATAFLHSWDLTAWSRYAACNLDTVGDIPVSDGQGVALYPGEDLYKTRDFSIVRGNRFTTVAKDATKLRGICIEPSLNVFYQLALGLVITERMRRNLGWDKQTCQDFHKLLARIGSLTGAIATIDLSNASDTICINLVKLLLPRDWLELVFKLRSSHTRLDGKWVKLEKFSSMGNGFTFELETLIFWTLSLAVQELESVDEDPYTPGLTTSVFGDDIIVPSSVSKTLVATLKFFGFTTNEQKTFLKGPFRESCGGDYFAGHDVRPHYLKVICDEPHRLIALANGIRRFDDRIGRLTGGVPNRDAWFRCLDAIPRQIRICRGPAELGDLVIHDDENHWQKRNPATTRNSIRYLRVWRPVANRLVGWEHYRPGVVLAVALYGGSSGASASYTRAIDPEGTLRRSGIVPRYRGSYISGYRFGRVAYS
jgi:hypothetical protein